MFRSVLKEQIRDHTQSARYRHHSANYIRDYYYYYLHKLTICLKNTQQADEQAEKKRLAEQQELDNNFTEMGNQINGDMLTENPDVAQSAFGPHRVIPDRWKGMSPEELEEIRRVQELQRQEKKRMEEEEKERDAEWERQRLTNARAGLLMEREQGRVKKSLDRDQVSANTRLGAEQKSQ